MQVESVSMPASYPASTSAGNTNPEEKPLVQNQKSKPDKREVELPSMQFMADELQDNLKLLHNVNLQFSVHQTSGKVVVAVTDKDSGELIREIPSREMLKLHDNLEEMMGMIFDRKI